MMSSLTKVQFRDEIKTRSNAISGLENNNIETFIDMALREYSRRLPEVRVSADNEVVSGQEFYDYPTDAESISDCRDSETLKPIRFTTENQGTGEKIRLGNILTRSYYDLIATDYYADPISFKSAPAISSYSTFDIEYVILQTMATIKNTGIEALAFYVEFLAYRKQAADCEMEDGERIIESLTDRDTTGATTEVSFAARGKIAENYRTLAQGALDKFDDAIRFIPYGTRG
ncbi:MAG: hypothetical protein ACYS1A_08170 [Planctomycetota bacterium]|jgi:hypothetical protein